MVLKLTVSECVRLGSLPLLPDPSDVLFQPAPWLDLRKERKRGVERQRNQGKAERENKGRCLPNKKVLPFIARSRPHCATAKKVATSIGRPDATQQSSAIPTRALVVTAFQICVYRGPGCDAPKVPQIVHAVVNRNSRLNKTCWFL